MKKLSERFRIYSPNFEAKYLNFDMKKKYLKICEKAESFDKKI